MIGELQLEKHETADVADDTDGCRPMEPTPAKRHPQTSHGPVFNLRESVESVDLTLFLRHLWFQLFILPSLG